MRVFKRIGLSLIAAIATMGCVQHVDLDVVPFESESSAVRFSVEATTSTSFSSTRAEGYNESSIHRAFIFFFDGDSYVGCYSIANGHALNEKGEPYIVNNGSSDVSIEILESGYSNDHNIIAVFNYKGVASDYSFEGITKTTVGDYFPMDRDYLEAVEKDQNSGAYELGIPMFTNDFDDSDTSVHEIYRSVARLEIFVRPDLDASTALDHVHNFDQSNVKMAILNSSSAGNIGFNTLDGLALSRSEDDAPIDADNFDFSTLDYSYIPSLDSDEAPVSEVANKIYLYEFPYQTYLIDGSEIVDSSTFHPGRLAVMIEHEDKSSHEETLYYKLNIVDQINKYYYDIKRNHDYKVIITAVHCDGYLSVEEAYRMPPSNVEYEVYDDQGHLTLSNGQYAISMDETLNYEEVQIYGRSEVELSFDNIRYIIPDVMANNATVDIEDLTNEVIFSIDESSITGTLSITCDNDFDDDNSKLTAEGQDIRVYVTGEGTCTISLLIRLGNLYVGTESLSIKKYGEGGEGSFDAHPGQQLMDGQTYVEGSWQSLDVDFGARTDSDGNLIIYMGENATPVGYKTMDGYVTTNSSADSYPYFEEKTREGYYTYSYMDGEEEKTIKTKVIMNQLAPAYLGHFGAPAPAGSPMYFKALISERIEEIERVQSWDGAHVSDTKGSMYWGESQGFNYYNNIYGNYFSSTRYLNITDGYAVSKYIVDYNKTEGALPLAARYCYMKNDVDGDEFVDEFGDEPVKWYLPALNQMTGMWISKYVYDLDVDEYKLSVGTGFDENYYHTCTEYNNNTTTPQSTDVFNQVLTMNMLEGDVMSSTNKDITWIKAHVRCVRDIDY